MMKLSEDTVIQNLIGYIQNVDADTLARLAGEAFGGKCTAKVTERKSVNGWVDTIITYDFEPNEFYADAFGEIEDDEED